MRTFGSVWVATCAALGLVWFVAVFRRAQNGAIVTATRAALGGAGALGTASVLYGALQLTGVDIRWEAVERGAWAALAPALAIGVVEEASKLVGILLAARAQAWRRETVFRAAAGVAVVFAVAEAAVATSGAGWRVALGRAALAPVAHMLLSSPLAVAVAEGGAGRRPLRIALALVVAAALHGAGNWSVARPAWGAMGFAATLLAPALWLYARAITPAPAGTSARART